jgi:RNA polymerase sigma factor (sigma-70 family)
LRSNEDERIQPESIKDLYDEHATELNAFLLGVLRDRDLVSEALQATFVKAMESGHTARKKTIKGWLFRVAFNEAMSIRRKQTIDRKAISKLSWLKPVLPGSTEGGFERACQTETVERIQAAINRLPPEQQYVVRARIYDQRKFAEIASELEVPLGTVLTRMRLAMTKLAARLRIDGLSTDG